VPSKLHERVVGIVRLLGPRHWASWRLLLLGTEMHCGVLEQALLQHKVRWLLNALVSCLTGQL
jgi:hypothetical protein